MTIINQEQIDANVPFTLPNEADVYRALLDELTGGNYTSKSLEETVPFETMQQFNEEMAGVRRESRRKAASSQQGAARIILNA